jgi:hypothetical protein
VDPFEASTGRSDIYPGSVTAPRTVNAYRAGFYRETQKTGPHLHPHATYDGMLGGVMEAVEYAGRQWDVTPWWAAGHPPSTSVGYPGSEQRSYAPGHGAQVKIGNVKVDATTSDAPAEASRSRLIRHAGTVVVTGVLFNRNVMMTVETVNMVQDGHTWSRQVETLTPRGEWLPAGDFKEVFHIVEVRHLLRT